MQTAAHARAAAMPSATVFGILFAVSSVHMLNDSMQTVVTALFPVFERSLQLTFAQMGWLGFALNMTSSVMQPVVGLYSDKRPTPGMLPVGMAISLLGMAGLAVAPNFLLLVLAVMLVGIGSAVFHPEGSRVVYFAAGDRRGLAQSIYQVGGNAGSSLAPLMTIFIFIPLGQFGAIWGTLLAAAAIAILMFVVPWYRMQLHAYGAPSKRKARPVDAEAGGGGSLAAAARIDRTVWLALALLIVIVFARSWYGAAMGSFYQFYLRDDYGISIETAQVALFLYLAAGVAGTLLGGMAADRFGRKRMMIFSIVGAAPFALMLPYLPLPWVYPVVAVIGFVMMSGFSVSVVYAQELLPGNVGLASGLITGFAFGMGALGGVVLGNAGDYYGSMSPVIQASSYLPLFGLLAFLLPKDRRAAS